MKILLIICLALLASCAKHTVVSEQRLSDGKKIAFTRSKGNCLACHKIADGESPGNIGPELLNLPARFNSKQQLKAQIWDATQFNPQTSMPPFGKNKILAEHEIDQLVDYLWILK